MLFRLVFSAVFAFTALLLGFSFLMGISKMDVSIKHDMERHVVAEPFEAGDIIEVSPDGQRIGSVLCSFDLGDTNHKRTEIRAEYYNLADASQAGFLRFLRNAKSTFGIPVANAAPDGPQTAALPFVGEVNRVVGEIEAQMPQSCYCRIAKAVIESRSKACVVEKSLVETRLSQTPGDLIVRKTVGISFRERSILFSDPNAVQGICPGINVAGSPPSQQSCSGQSGFSFDVVARSKIGLIREARIAD